MLMLALLHRRLPKRGVSSSKCVRLPPHWDSTYTVGNFQLIKVRQPIKNRQLVEYNMLKV